MKAAKLVWMATAAGIALSVAGCGGGGSDKIQLIGRMSSSGTYEYFREVVLGKEARFRQGISAQDGSKDVVEMCAKTPSAIGYSGMGYKTNEVKILKLSKKKGEPGVEPTIENARSGKYSLSRPLYIYTRGEPEGAMKHYLEWIVSTEGQAVVEAEGCVPNVNPTPPPAANPPAAEIRVEGSDTMLQLAGKWALVYGKKYTNVKIAVKGGGSGAGIGQLINGKTDLANASREMSKDEKSKAQAGGGKEVKEFVVGMDAIAIYAHKDNSLESISLEELKDIFIEDGQTTQWSQLKK